jgi:hypothetical protein
VRSLVSVLIPTQAIVGHSGSLDTPLLAIFTEEELRPRFPRSFEEIGDFHHGLIRAYLLRRRWNNLRHSRSRIWRGYFDGKFHVQWHACAEAYKFGTSSRYTYRLSELCRTRVAGSCAGPHRTHTRAFLSSVDTGDRYIRNPAPKPSGRTLKNPS